MSWSESQKRYYYSSKGIVSRKKYQQSEKGRASARRYYEKRKLRLKALKAVQTVTEDKSVTDKQGKVSNKKEIKKQGKKV